MQLPCGALERTQSGKVKLLALPGKPLSDNIAVWLEEWLRHERQTMEERHVSMLSQVGQMMGSERPASAVKQPLCKAQQEGLTENSAVELANLMRPISTQLRELTADLRTTHSDIGILRTTIEASIEASSRLHVDSGLGSPAAPDLQTPLPTAQNGTGVPTNTKECEEHMNHEAPAKQGYRNSALQAVSTGNKELLTPWQRFVYWMEHEVFEIFFGTLILLNTIALALEVQYEGLQTGHDIGYAGYSHPSSDEWPWAKDTFMWMERVFTSLFTLEFILRFLVLQRKCLWDRWMYLDAFVVIFSWLALFGNSPTKMNVTALRIIRIGRMLRILRVVRYIRFFDSLYLMVRSVQSSWSALIWSFALLMMVQVIAGMILCQMIISWIEDNKSDPGVDKLFEYFGTFSRTTLTMWEIMMANWITPARLTVNTCGELWTLFFLGYRCMLGFALLAVISAVFIHETMKVADTDDEVAVFLAQRDTALYAAKLQDAFLELDDSGDGYVNWQELSQIMEDEIMKNWLKSMQIDTTQVHNLFHVLDDGDGKISYQEFMSGIQKVKVLWAAILYMPIQ